MKEIERMLVFLSEIFEDDIWVEWKPSDVNPKQMKIQAQLMASTLPNLHSF